MTRVLIDANIFLNIFLDEENKEECIAFLERIKEGKVKGYLLDITINIILLILKYPEKVKTFLEFLRAFEDKIVIVRTDYDDYISATIVSERFNLDFDDSLHYYIVKKLDLDGIVSYDRDFDKTDIKRIEPKELIN